MSGELYELALSVPWCCTSEALEAMLALASREPIAADEVARRMHGPRSLALRNGQRREDSRTMTMLGSVARIPIDGPIYRYADFFTSMSGGVTTESLARDLQTALDDPAVGGILLAIDSPGGEATGINELADAIYAARGRKPIAAYIEGYGASAAYWIASAADLVVADDSALIGSIGTILGVPDPTKRPSTRIDIVSTQSPKKRPDVTTDAGRAVLQQLADDMTEVFIAKVMRNRNMSREQVLAIQGGMLVGQQAIDAGLADRLGSEDGTLRALATSDLRTYLAAPARVPGDPSQHREGSMQLFSKEWWANLFAAQAEAEGQPLAAVAGGGVVPITADQLARMEAAAAPLLSAQSKADDDERTSAAATENAELKRQIAQLQAAQIGRDAQAFAKEQITTGHALPVEQQAMMALYTRAAELDATSPRTDGQPSCVALLTAAYTARPANRLASNLLDPAFTADAKVLTNQTGTGDPYAEDQASIRAYGERLNGKR